MALPVQTDPRKMPVEQYFDICTKSLNSQEFGKILSKKVTLLHYTNAIKDGEAKGRNDVLELFIINLFSNTKIVDCSKPTISDGPNGTYHLAFVVGEDKANGDTSKRFCFLEGTTFEVKKSKKTDLYKIASITSYVIRQEIPM